MVSAGGFTNYKHEGTKVRDFMNATLKLRLKEAVEKGLKDRDEVVGATGTLDSARNQAVAEWVLDILPSMMAMAVVNGESQVDVAPVMPTQISGLRLTRTDQLLWGSYQRIVAEALERVGIRLCFVPNFADTGRSVIASYTITIVNLGDICAGHAMVADSDDEEAADLAHALGEQGEDD